MKKKKVLYLLPFFVIIVVLVTIVLATKPYYKEESLFIGDNSASFRMTETEFRIKKGNPLEVHKGNVSIQKRYICSENINGYKAKSQYIFARDCLIQAKITIDNIDYSEAISMCETMLQNQDKFYSDHKGYYKNDIESNDGIWFETSWGVAPGATRTMFEYKYSMGSLYISASILE